MNCILFRNIDDHCNILREKISNCSVGRSNSKWSDRVQTSRLLWREHRNGVQVYLKNHIHSKTLNLSVELFDKIKIIIILRDLEIKINVKFNTHNRIIVEGGTSNFPP